MFKSANADRDTQYKQQVAENRTNDRGPDDIYQAFTEGQNTNNQFSRIAKGRKEQSANLLTCMLCYLFYRLNNQLNKRENTHARNPKTNHRSTVHKIQTNQHAPTLYTY